MPVITKIARQKNNNERYNLYLDEKYAFSLDEAVLIKYQLSKGKVIEELDFNSAVQRASVNWGVVRKLIVCANCGGQALYDASQVSGCCPF
ncbi:MAG: hypothetical protein ABS938_20245, partial [Psychrobacillus psychrodurans]